MSSYPPGVSGREWQIAGPDFENEQDMVCEAQDVTVKVLLVDGSTVDFDVEQCQWKGQTLVTGYRGDRWWVCPACLTEHEGETERD